VGSDPLAGAMRELAEETKLAARDWRQVLSFELSNSITDEHGFGYLAMDLYPTEEGRLDDTELLHLARVPFREALDLAVSGVLTDMITVAMLLRAYHMAREGELPPALTRAML
jgi:8-oxo-dGTP pyrophosphatase MutT (NUDIX family)